MVAQYLRGEERTALRLYRNIGVLLSGTMLAQMINIVASPILSRLYSPEAFGIFGLYSAVSMVLSVPAALRYDVAIVLPADDEDARDLARLASMCVILVTLLLLAALVLARTGSAIVDVSLGGHWEWLWFVPMVVLARGAYLVATSWAMRRSQFADITRSRISQPIAATLAQLLAAALGAGAIGLVGGQFLGQAVASMVLIVLVAKQSSISGLAKIDIDRLWRVARSYSQFPKYSTPQSFISLAAQYVPVFVFARFFGAAFLGYYTLMDRVVHLPSTIVGQAVREAFLPQLAEAHRQGRAHEELRRMVKVLALVGGIPALIIVPLAPALFAWVFGADWRIAGVYAQVVAPHIVMGFVIPPVSTAMQVLNQQKWYARFELVRAVIAALAAVIGGISQNPLLALGAYATVGVVASLTLMRKAFRIARRGAADQ